MVDTNKRTAKAKGVADAINQSGGQAIAVPGDMLDAEYIKVLVKKAAEFGNGKIHIIVNNAGLVFQHLVQTFPVLRFCIVTPGTELSTR
jgi:NAD(P)-dependent dehydrogenase (short-subunit alcohol dehydrogenase family)